VRSLASVGVDRPMVCPSTSVKLSELAREVWDLADRHRLTDAEEQRWQQLMPHWQALANRINEDRN
jgi:hypothetical protein